LNAEALVTGHYIASHRGEGGWEMHRPHDARRDQSYFLFSTTEEQLSFLRFPLANLAKDEVRNIASLFELCVADKPDSQDICFVPNGDYAHIIEKLRPDAAESGDIVNMEGEKLGSHKGIIHYTIGQRRGLGIASGEPLYVVGIDADKHRVIVGPREALAKREISLQEVNWLGEKNSAAFQKGGLPIHARIRSTTEPQPARLWLSEKKGAHIQLDSPEEGVSAGQACVFYSATPPHRRVLGGGWIS
ncbi:MAG: MnmA/TRMU family protein, partial [Parvibaculales bacterium]